MAQRSAVRIETKRLVLLQPPPGAAPLLVKYFEANREHLLPWDPPRPRGFYSIAFWRMRLASLRKEAMEDRSVRLSLFLRGKPRGPIVGQLSLSEIQRGPLHSCTLGYSLDHRYQGRGLMTEAAGAAVDYAFRELRLHRVGASYVPSNERSAKVLRALGFSVEGYARHYLYVGGAWRDHVLTARLNPDPRFQPARTLPQ